MEIILPEAGEIEFINQSRKMHADAMLQTDRPGAPMTAIVGPCSPDTNRMPDGQLATVAHLRQLQLVTTQLEHVDSSMRFVAVKPRTAESAFTGILHMEGGAEIYTTGAWALTGAGVALESEIMDESDLAIAGPWLTIGRIGARNVEDTGARYLVRPTTQEIDRGVHPMPVYVKNGADGKLDSVVSAISTITNEGEVQRIRLTLDGARKVTTKANPHVGVILRGRKQRPDGPLDEIILEEVGTARRRLDSEFGVNVVPLVLDGSHDHAKYSGGGHVGQERFIQAVIGLLRRGHHLPITGIMAETYIHAGKQPEFGDVPGLSWTDEGISEAQICQDLREFNEVWPQRKLPVAA